MIDGEWTKVREPLEPWGTGVGPPPGWFGHVIPADRLPPRLTRTYEGTSAQVGELRQIDAAVLAVRGYYPIGESWMPKSRTFRELLRALILMFLLIGLVMLICYWMTPLGVLSVTYERRTASLGGPDLTDSARGQQTSAMSSPGADRAASKDLVLRLQELEGARAAGLVTDAEFAAKRDQILGDH